MEQPLIRVIYGAESLPTLWSSPMARFLLVVLLAVSLSACTTNKRPDDAKTVRSQRVDLDPMLVQPGEDGEAIDVNELFERAYTAYGNRQYEEAAESYRAVVKYFPESRFFLPAAYNAGLSYEKIDRLNDAAEMYRLIIEKDRGAEEAKDAYYRRAAVLEQLGRHETINELMTEVLLRNDLSNFDRVEAHVRRANALGQIGNYEEAADGYRTALKLNHDAPAGEQLSPRSNYIVQSYFGLGRVHHARVSEIKLKLPPERMGEDLKEKADIFMRAQSNYIRALGFHHPQWSMAAGFMIGKLYEDFYTDIFTAEIPDDLTDEAVALYFEELRKQIRPLMVRAVQVYEKNLSLSKRIPGTDGNEWVANTQTQLERLQAYLDDPETQQRAERFAMRGQSFDDMWAPVPVARDAIDVAVVAGVAAQTPRPQSDEVKALEGDGSSADSARAESDDVSEDTAE